jgi:hypothetical protein
VRQYSPNIIDVCSVVRNASQLQAGLPDGRYVPARPIGWQSFGQRFRAAWLVFTGRADALTWPGQ